MILASLARNLSSASWPGAAFLRYLLAGLAALAVDFTTFALLHHALGLVVVANLVSRPLGGVTSFLAHRKFTFHGAAQGSAPLQFTSFWCVFGMSLAFTSLLLALLCDLLKVPAVPAKALAEAAAVVFNFLVLKHWTFR